MRAAADRVAAARHKVKNTRASGIVGEVFGKLSEAEIDALLPRDIFRMLVKVAVMARDEKMLHLLARDWGPYEHARKSETVTFTPEEVRRLADAARLEASRRGMVIDVTERRAA